MTQTQRVRSRSPNPTKSSSHPPVAQLPNPAPTFNIFLDPGLIPSLPPPGGHVGHHELMGRPRFASSDTAIRMNVGDIAPPLPPKDDVVVGRTFAGKSGLRPGMHRRSSSMEQPLSVSASGNRAGVGAGAGAGFGVGEVVGGRSGSGQSSDLGPPRPGVVRRTSSFEDGLVMVKRDTSALPKPKGTHAPRHQRTASDSTNDTLTPRRDVKHARSTSSVPSFLATYSEGYIRLGTDKDLPVTSKLLLTLSALTPAERVADTDVPPPSSGVLHPSVLLAPLAIILEALVAERTVLKSETPGPLPLLRDGSSLQLKGGEGELDWSVMKPYIIAVGSVISQLMPYLQGSKEKKEVEGLTKGLRVYVGKQKKVFGEVASMYVDGYGFMRGWWDEGGMKGCAGEIGRWGDMVDA